MEISDTPLNRFIEDTVKLLVEQKPEKVAVVAFLGDQVATAYHNCTPTDKALASHNVYMDSVFDVILANADRIIEAADNIDDEYIDEEDDNDG